MNKHFIYLIILISLSLVTNAQQKTGNNLSFCGWRFKDSSIIREKLGKQLSFLRIADNDTIVDIGASSGEYEGCLSVIGDFKNAHFVLVDIDSNCLNTTRVNNMVSFYANVKGEPIKQQFSIVQNTVDSLYLPENHYKKAWLMNTLHEIPDKQKMISDINKILQPGGELVLLELLSIPKHTIHSGCHKPLMDMNEIETLFVNNGFRKDASIDNPSNAKKFINPVMMIRFIKN